MGDIVDSLLKTKRKVWCPRKVTYLTENVNVGVKDRRGPLGMHAILG